MARILVVDDEVGIRELLSEILYDEGHTVELAENAAQARAARLRMRPDLVLLDIWMPDTDGVSLLKEWASQGLLDMPVIMMSGHATIDTAASNGQLGSISLDQPLREARDEFERIYFEYHLVRENHSMTRVSERTGLERTHLYRKLKQLGIESARKRGT